MRGFKNLTDPSKLTIKPSRIRIVPTRRNGPMRQVLRTLGAPKGKLEEWAVMNGMRLGETIRTGTLVKIISK